MDTTQTEQTFVKKIICRDPETRSTGCRRCILNIARGKYVTRIITYREDHRPTSHRTNEVCRICQETRVETKMGSRQEMEIQRIINQTENSEAPLYRIRTEERIKTTSKLWQSGNRLGNEFLPSPRSRTEISKDRLRRTRRIVQPYIASLINLEQEENRKADNRKIENKKVENKKETDNKALNIQTNTLNENPEEIKDYLEAMQLLMEMPVFNEALDILVTRETNDTQPLDLSRKSACQLETFLPQAEAPTYTEESIENTSNTEENDLTHTEEDFNITEHELLEIFASTNSEDNSKQSESRELEAISAVVKNLVRQTEIDYS